MRIGLNNHISKCTKKILKITFLIASSTAISSCYDIDLLHRVYVYPATVTSHNAPSAPNTVERIKQPKTLVYKESFNIEINAQSTAAKNNIVNRINFNLFNKAYATRDRLCQPHFDDVKLTNLEVVTNTALMDFPAGADISSLFHIEYVRVAVGDDGIDTEDVCHEHKSHEEVLPLYGKSIADFVSGEHNIMYAMQLAFNDDVEISGRYGFIVYINEKRYPLSSVVFP